LSDPVNHTVARRHCERHADADEDQPVAEHATAIRAQVDDERRREAADERSDRHLRGARAIDEDDHPDRAERRAGVEPDDVRRCERVLGERLEDRAGEAE
jgi:hypothetical protein